MIRTPDGRVLYGMMVSTVVKPFLEVRRWQLRQTSDEPARASWWYPRRPGGPRPRTRSPRSSTEKFGRGLQFEVVPVDDIPLAPTGKLQTIVPCRGRRRRATS